MYFLDTSALVKIYHDECGSERMRNIYFSSEKILISELAKLEFLSATLRKFREGVFDEGTRRALIERFAADCQTRYELLRLSPVISQATEDILTSIGLTSPLRTLDAMQMAFFQSHCGSQFVFVSADRCLTRVLFERGQAVLDPAL